MLELAPIMSIPTYTAAELPPCAQRFTPAFAQVCGDCALGAQGACQLLELAQAYQDSERSNEDKSWAQVTDGFRTIAGIEDLVRTNPNFARLLTIRRVGSELIDLRGVHAINETYGRRAGDVLLRAAAARLITRREIAPTAQPERRKAKADVPMPDFGFRGDGADELGVVRNDLTLGDLKQIIVPNTTDVFSINNAVNDDQSGRLPILATVSFAHSSEVDLPRTAHPRKILDGMLELLYDRHDALKVTQYSAMWRRIVDMCVERGVPVPEKPRDPRLIVERFWELATPNFSANAEELLSDGGSGSTRRR
jgi:hypothetical protein